MVISVFVPPSGLSSVPATALWSTSDCTLRDASLRPLDAGRVGRPDTRIRTADNACLLAFSISDRDCDSTDTVKLYRSATLSAKAGIEKSSEKMKT